MTLCFFELSALHPNNTYNAAKYFLSSCGLIPVHQRHVHSYIKIDRASALLSVLPDQD